MRLVPELASRKSLTPPRLTGPLHRAFRPLNLPDAMGPGTGAARVPDGESVALPEGETDSARKGSE